MEDLSTTIFRHFVRGFGALVLFAFATAGTVFAETITKTFEFGLGTANSISNKRTFPVPCGLDPSATVKYYRLGEAGAQFDAQIAIELRLPGEDPAEEGALSLLKYATAKRTEQTITLVGVRSNLGCSLPWVVRIRPLSGQSPVAIKGSITVTYISSTITLRVEGGSIFLKKGESVTTNISFLGGFVQGQGRVVVTATWLHALGPVPGPLPVKLKFELLDPNGNVVSSDSGYSNAEINPCCSGNKMKITYQFPSCISGQWKIRITNNTNDDTRNIETKATFTPDCP